MGYILHIWLLLAGTRRIYLKSAYQVLKLLLVLLMVGPTASKSQSSSGRIFEIDLVRGICLIEMMANHLPSNLVTRGFVQSAGFISAAEGFVFLSGFVSGWTSTSALAENKPLGLIAQRFLSRGLKLYAIYCVFVTVVLTAVAGDSWFSEWGRLCDVTAGSASHVWPYAMVLLRQLPYLDIFAMYCIFLVLVPLVLAGLRVRRFWLPCTISAGVWLISQFGSAPNLPVMIKFGFFNLFSWQLLFVIGVTVGYHYDLWKQKLTRPRWLTLVCAALCLTLFSIRHLMRLGVHVPVVTSFNLVEKSTLGAVRLLNFAACAYSLRVVLVWLGSGVRGSRVCQQLAFLGQHSLQVFSWSIGITFLAFLSGTSWWHLPVAVQMCLACGAIGSLWVPARLHSVWCELHQERRRPRTSGNAQTEPLHL